MTELYSKREFSKDRTGNQKTHLLPGGESRTDGSSVPAEVVRVFVEKPSM